MTYTRRRLGIVTRKKKNRMSLPQLRAFIPDNVVGEAGAKY